MKLFFQKKKTFTSRIIESAKSFLKEIFFPGVNNQDEKNNGNLRRYIQRGYDNRAEIRNFSS